MMNITKQVIWCMSITALILIIMVLTGNGASFKPKASGSFPESPTYTNALGGIELEVDAYDDDWTPVDIRMYASPEPYDTNHSLVARSVKGWNKTLSHELTAIPVQPDNGTVLLLHMDGLDQDAYDHNYIVDASGRGHNASLHDTDCCSRDGDNPPDILAGGGRFAGGLWFDGFDDYAEVKHHSDFDTVDRTVEFWFHTDLVEQFSNIVGRHAPDENNSYMTLFFSWNYIHLKASNATSSLTLMAEAPAGQWHHIAGTYDNETLKLYVNGELADQGQLHNATHLSGRNIPWIIGTDPVWKNWGFFNGTVDDVAVHARAMNETEVKLHSILAPGSYLFSADARDSTDVADAVLRFKDENGTRIRTSGYFNVTGIEYGVAMDHPGHRVVDVGESVVYKIVVRNTGEVVDAYTVELVNTDDAETAVASMSEFLLSPNGSKTIELTIADRDPGSYSVAITVSSNKIANAIDSLDIVTTFLPENVAIGTYLLGDDWYALGNITEGVDRIKELGGSAVLISVGSFEVLWDSEYLPSAWWYPEGRLEEVVDYAHKRGLKVYAWYGMPHDHFLNRTRHPEWISLLSNGTPVNHTYDDYFYRIIPASRVIAEQEYLDILKGVMGELADIGFDGIDINDNFQFLEDSSFDNFTVDRFSEAVGVEIPSGNVSERSQFIKENITLYDLWFEWRADQVTQLLSLMQGYIRDAGSDIPLRPHLMVGGYGYWGWGYNWSGIANAVDAPYVMLPYGWEYVNESISTLLEAGARDVVCSFYLDNVNRSDTGMLAENLTYAVEAGASEIFLFTWMHAENRSLWKTLADAVESANGNASSDLMIGDPSYPGIYAIISPDTELWFNDSRGEAVNDSVIYRINNGAWLSFNGTFRINGTGINTIEWYPAGSIGSMIDISRQELMIDTAPPTISISFDGASLTGDGWPQMYATPETKILLDAEDDLTEIAELKWAINFTSADWFVYNGSFTLPEPAHALLVYSKDSLGNGRMAVYTIIVDGTGPAVFARPGDVTDGKMTVKNGTSIELYANDDSALTVDELFFSIDNGTTWTEYTKNISVSGPMIIKAYAVDQLGNQGNVRTYRIEIEVEQEPLDPDDESNAEFDPSLMIMVIGICLLIFALTYRAMNPKKEDKN